MAAIVGHQGFNPLPLGLEVLHFTIQLPQLLLRRPAIHAIVIRNPPVEVGTHPPVSLTLPGRGGVVRQARQRFFNLVELVSQCFLFCGHEELSVFFSQRSGDRFPEFLMQCLPLVRLLAFERPTSFRNPHLTLLFAGFQHDPEGFKPGLPLGDKGLHLVELVQFCKRLLESLRSQHFGYAEIGRLDPQTAVGIRENPVAVTSEVKLRHQTLFSEPIPDNVQLLNTGLVKVGRLPEGRQCSLWFVHLLKNIGPGERNLLAPWQKQIPARQRIERIKCPIRPALPGRRYGIVEKGLVSEYAIQRHVAKDLKRRVEPVIPEVKPGK